MEGEADGELVLVGLWCNGYVVGAVTVVGGGEVEEGEGEV